MTGVELKIESRPSRAFATLPPTASRPSDLARGRARGWSRLSIRTRLILLATVPQLLYTNVMTLLGTQAMHVAQARLDVKLGAIPGAQEAFSHRYANFQESTYILVSLALGLISAVGAILVARRLRERLDELRIAAGRIARGDLDTQIAYSGAGEIAQIGGALDDMRSTLRRRIHLEIEARHVEQDQAIVNAVERMFLPPHTDVEGACCSLAVFHRAAQRCSGDIWHYHEEEDGTLWVMLGDVAGNGPGPAMLAASVVTAYRVRIERGGLADPTSLLAGIHDTIVATVGAQLPVALSMLRVSPGGMLTWWSAGMTPLFVRKVGDGVEDLESTSRPLGHIDCAPSESSFELEPGDMVFACTSGVLVASEGQLSRVRDAFGSARHDTARGNCDGVAANLGLSSRGHLPEDVTLVVLARRVEVRP